MASNDELTNQVVALNAAITDINERFEGANRTIQGQFVRIAQLEAQVASGQVPGAAPQRQEYERRIDLKALTPENFTSKDEGRWRERAEEFVSYIESINELLALLMEQAVD